MTTTIKVAQTVSRRAYLGLWASVNTAFFSFVPIGGPNCDERGCIDQALYEDPAFICLLLINVAFILTYLGIEKAGLQQFLGRLITTIMDPQEPAEIKVAKLKEATDIALSTLADLRLMINDANVGKEVEKIIKKLSVEQRRKITEAISKLK